MDNFDIFNPMISKVTTGLEGKTILIYGSNRTGKTSVSVQFDKPYYFPFENGLNAISGIPFLPIQKWSDFKKLNKKLTNPKTLNKTKELYQTLIFDGVESAALKCQDYICQKYDAESIKSGNGGYGLWSEYETEFKREIDLLTSVGYTVIFISHEGERKLTDEAGEEYTKIYPKGDKRSIDPICDLVDIIAYTKTNGLDENNKEIKSSLLLTNTRKYHAGTRFDYMPPFLKEFTKENLESAIKEAVEKQEAEKKGSTIDYAKYREEIKVEKKTADELKEEIKEIAKEMNENGKLKDFNEIVEKYLGEGSKVSKATNKQVESLDLILNDLKELNN